MTGLCPDVDIDRKILRSGVCVDRKLLHPVRILCSNVVIDLAIPHPCYTHVLLIITIVIRSRGMLTSIVNAFVTSRGLRFVSYI